MKEAGDHSLLARLRRAGANPSAFRHQHLFRWTMMGIGVLALLLILPYLEPRAAPFTDRLLTLCALVFLVAAPGLWMGLGSRSFLVATTFVLALYGVTGWTGAILQQSDLFVAAGLLGMAVFGLAGFNIVFVLEEVVYDAHRLLRHRTRAAWVAMPTLAVAALAVGIPLMDAYGGPALPATWIAAITATVLMLSWWFFHLVNRLAAGLEIVRELHLFVAGIMLAALVADSIPFLVAAEALLPGLVAYLILIGTWVYVTYTTLQRTHFLLKGRNAAPWIAILLGASYAIGAHAQALSGSTGELVTAQLLFEQRMEFMVAGIAVGVLFYVGRSFWRGLRLLTRSGVLTARGQRVAGRAARLAEGVRVTERRVAGATMGLYRRFDEVLPGHHAARGWEFDEESPVRSLEEE